MTKRILLVGGGSGGHVYPLIAVAHALRQEAQRRGVTLELKILGEGAILERAAQESQIPFQRIMAGKLRRYVSPLVLLDFLKMPIGFLQSLWHVFWFMPDVIFAKGGYASVAPSLVGRLYVIPLFIHESDSAPGLSNRLLGGFARAIFVSFKSSAQHFKNQNIIFSGNPVRKELFAADRSTAFSFFQLDPNIKTLLVLGGSQGAKQINDIILSSLVVLTNPERGYQKIGRASCRERV